MHFTIAIDNSLFSKLKDTSITTMLQLNRLTLPGVRLSYQSSLQRHLVLHQKLAHWPEQFQWVQLCNRSRSTTLLTVKRNRWCCLQCNVQLAPECRILCPVRMLLLEMPKTWTARVATGRR